MLTFVSAFKIPFQRVFLTVFLVSFLLVLELFVCNSPISARNEDDKLLLATRSGAFDQFGSRDWSQKMAKYRSVYMQNDKTSGQNRKIFNKKKHNNYKLKEQSFPKKEANESSMSE